MENSGLLYEGKAKRIYATEQEMVVRVEYKDSATAFNGEKKSEITGKGVLNNEISSLIFTLLKSKGINSHFIQRLSETEQLVQRVTIIPLEVVVRNVIAGSLSKRLGIEEGTSLSKPIVEFYYKNDELGDPLVNEDHILTLQLASLRELDILRTLALKINVELSKLFQSVGVRLVDFKLEFGKDSDGLIVLADEISPDTCRLWDAKTNAKLDKDVFRRDLGDLTKGYREILNRLRGAASHV
jgi:phosphoribosylaminoimidazole-succinocarboxamide synthase